MTLNFPPIQPLRTGISVLARAPSVCAIYRRAKNGRLVLVGAAMPGRFGFGQRTKKKGVR